VPPDCLMRGVVSSSGRETNRAPFRGGSKLPMTDLFRWFERGCHESKRNEVVESERALRKKRPQGGSVIYRAVDPPGRSFGWAVFTTSCAIQRVLVGALC